MSDTQTKPEARPKAINEYCPWSGKPVDAQSLTLYRGHVVGFCNTGCRDKFVDATRLFDAAIDAEASISSNPQETS